MFNKCYLPHFLVKPDTAATRRSNPWLNGLFTPISFIKEKHSTVLRQSFFFFPSSLQLYDVKQGEKERKINELSLLHGHQYESSPTANERWMQMEQVCIHELITWPALQQLQHGFTPVTDFIANCSEPEYGKVVIIKRFNGMLGALDFDCFFLLSYVRGHY